MRGRAAVSMVEVLIVVFLLVFGMLVLLTVYTSNLRNATLTRGSLLASLICESIFAEVREHRYGSPAPPSWGDARTRTPFVESYPVWVQGRPVLTTFRVLITPAPNESNGSFFDATKREANDVIWCRIEWDEGTDDKGARATKYFELTMDVRRERDLVVPTE